MPTRRLDLPADFPAPPHRLIRCPLGLHPAYSPTLSVDRLSDFIPADRYHESWLITGEPRTMREVPSDMTLHVISRIQREYAELARRGRWGAQPRTECLDRLDDWVDKSTDTIWPLRIEGRNLVHGYRYSGGNLNQPAARTDLALPALRIAIWSWFVDHRSMAPLLTDFLAFDQIYAEWIRRRAPRWDFSTIPDIDWPTGLIPYLRIPLVIPDSWMRQFSTHTQE